jgi:dihydrofolate reductase
MSREFDLLLGRRTYKIWAAFWPYANHPVANAFNKAGKIRRHEESRQPGLSELASTGR